MITARESIILLASFVFLNIFFRNPTAGIIGFGLLVIAQFTNPINAFYFYLLCYPFSFLDQFNVAGIRVDNIFVSAIAALAILKVAIKEGQNMLPLILRNRRVLRNLVLVALFSLGVFMSSLTVNEFPMWVKSLGSVLSFVIPILLIRNEQDFLSAITFLKISAFVLAVSGILCAFNIVQFDYFTPKLSTRSPLEGAFGSTGLMDSRGAFGVYMAFILPFIYLGLSSFFKEKKRTSLLKRGIPFLVNLIFLVTILIAIALTGSRATWLMAITVTGLYIAFSVAARIGIKNAAMIFIPLGVMSLIVLNEVILSILQSVHDISAASADARMENNLAAMASILKHPLFGIGHEKIFFISDLQIVVHNMFLSIGAENGIISLVPVLLLFLFTFQMLVDAVRHSSSPEMKKIGLCLIISFIGMLINLNFYAGGDKHVWLNLGLMNIFFFLEWDKRRRTPPRVAAWNPTTNGVPKRA